MENYTMISERFTATATATAGDREYGILRRECKSRWATANEIEWFAGYRTAHGSIVAYRKQRSKKRAGVIAQWLANKFNFETATR